MDIHKYRLLDFFDNSLTFVKRFQNITKSFDINVSFQESFGNKCIEVINRIHVNWPPEHQLNDEDMGFLRKTNYTIDASSVIGSYAFPLQNRNVRAYAVSNYLRNLKEFYDTYTNSSLIVGKLLLSIIPTAQLRIAVLEKYPQFILLQEYWKEIEFNFRDYEKMFQRNFTDDVSLFPRILQGIGANWNRHTASTVFIGENEIRKEYQNIHISDLRYFVLEKEVPFKLKDATQNELLIDAKRLNKALTLQNHLTLLPQNYLLSKNQESKIK